MAPWQRVAVGMFAVGWGANQFTPMLVVYRDELGLSDQTRAILFGVYAAGLIPGLLLGGRASDARGRRAVVIPFVLASPLATVLLVVFREHVAGLAAGRTLAGVCSGVVFGAATAWLRELSAGEAEGVAARRAAIALTCGFAVGPLVTSVLAEVVGEPLWEPYLPHIALGIGAGALILAASEPARASAAERRPLIPAVCRSARFFRTIVCVAPWVFASASVPFAILPTEVAGGSALLAGVAGAGALLAGVAVQPLARRLEDRRPLASGAVGLLATMLGLGIGILAVSESSTALVLVSAPFFGVGYGGVLIAGLRETERIAAPAELGATVSVFYALTYLGFATPYVAEGLAGPLSDQGALAALAGVAALCLAVSTTRTNA